MSAPITIPPIPYPMALMIALITAWSIVFSFLAHRWTRLAFQLTRFHEGYKYFKLYIYISQIKSCVVKLEFWEKLFKMAEITEFPSWDTSLSSLLSGEMRLKLKPLSPQEEKEFIRRCIPCGQEWGISGEARTYIKPPFMLNIALNTFKEIVRNRFLYLIVFFACVFIIFSLALWELTIGESERVIVDFGLGMIEIFGIIGVLFVGSQLLFKEIEGKTIFLILSKPIKREDFLLGKYFWFSWAIFLIVFFQALVFLLLLLFSGIQLTPLILWSLFFTFLKLEILLGIVFFLSTFMSHIMTIMISLMIYLISHSFSLVLDLFSRLQENAFLAVQTIQLLFPPLQALNTKDVIGSFSDFGLEYFLFNSIYAMVYIMIVLFFAVQIFSRKTFEE